MEIEWREIKGKDIPNMYSISSRGEIRNDITGNILSAKNGNKAVLLMSTERRLSKTHQVKRLMYKAFIGDIPAGYYVMCDGELNVDSLRLVRSQHIRSVTREDRPDVVEYVQNKIMSYWLTRLWI